MGKYIIELKQGEMAYKTVDSKGTPMIQLLAPTPYTEPDLEQVKKEAFEEGYKTAKVQCNIQAEKDMREVGKRHYQRGLSDAWEAVRKIYNFDLEEREELFHDSERFNVGSICEAYSASEAIEKIRQYEQKKEEDGLRQNIQTIVDQCGYSLDEIAEVLAKMKETNNG